MSGLHPVLWETARADGLGLRIGAHAKTWIVRVPVVDERGRRKYRKQTLGRFPEMSAADARKLAQKARAKGTTREPLTLQRDFDKWVLERTRRWSELTLVAHNYAFSMLPESWKSLRLDQIDADAFGALFERISEDRGPVAANFLLRTMRALYRKRGHLYGLSENKCPTFLIEKNKTKARGLDFNLGTDFPDLWAKIHAQEPVARDVYVVAMFTALRKQEVLALRWEHIDFDARTARIARPKGGADRAFDIPLTEPVVDALLRRRVENEALLGRPDEGWVFPSQSVKGGRLRDCRRKGSDVPGPHQFRTAWMALAATIIPLYALKVLVNHESSDVTFKHYAKNLSMSQKREAAETVTAEILNRIHPEKGGSQ